ncbi:MAG: Glu-tRNA(Gln) amidotransferase subunit GatD [Thermoprotei archaeon]
MLKEGALEGYRGLAYTKLAEAGARVGDTVEVCYAGECVVGRLMPHTEGGDDTIVVLKLSNGYNVGLSVADASVRVVSASGGIAQQPSSEGEGASVVGGGYVALISTGGTIASRVEYETGAVRPALRASDLLSLVPELGGFGQLKTKVLMSILSEDMKPSYWERIAHAVFSEVMGGAVGVVVAHGTDTMGYTAAALSFALRGVGVPIVLVGSQRSSDRPSSDAHTNLVSAVRFAKESHLPGVYVCMHHSTSDPTCAVMPGVKVRKMHTSRRDAFRCVNAQPVALVERDGIVFLGGAVKRASSGGLEFKPAFSDRAALLQYYPGFKLELLEWLAGSGCLGVVLAGTGLGHVSSELVEGIARLRRNGLLVYMTSQCLYGRVNMNVYTTGRRLLAAGVVPLGDMLPETAYVKLSWALANHPFERVDEVMRSNIVGEISERSVYTGEPA